MSEANGKRRTNLPAMRIVGGCEYMAINYLGEFMEHSNPHLTGCTCDLCVAGYWDVCGELETARTLLERLAEEYDWCTDVPLLYDVLTFLARRATPAAPAPIGSGEPSTTPPGGDAD